MNKSPLLIRAEQDLEAAQVDYRKHLHSLKVSRQRLDDAEARHRSLLFKQVEVDMETKAAGPVQRVRR